jgi:hypothetical protein
MTFPQRSEDKGWLVGEIQQLFTKRQRLLDEWVQFYHRVFHLDVNLSTLKIPKRDWEFTRLIVVAKGLTLKRVLEVSQEHYRVEVQTWRYTYGEEETRGQHDRLPTEHYAVWVRDRVDADGQYRSVVSSQRPWKQWKGHSITLLEHLLFSLKYFQETRRLLDRREIGTSCFGSRDSGGCIPWVFAGKDRAGKSMLISYGEFGPMVRVREVIA